MISLDHRLTAIASFVPHGCIPLDIGTDHGRLPVYLIMSGVCKKVIASDISAPSLKKADSLIRKCGVADRVEVRLGNGISVIAENEADSLIIAGMGGNMLISILEESRQRWGEFRSFILQPMSSQAELREYLVENGLCITDEEIAFDNGRYYEVMLVSHGRQKPLSELECIVGPVLAQKQGTQYSGYFQRKIRSVSKALDGVLASDKPEIRAKAQHYECLLKDMRGLAKCHADAKTS